MWHGKQTGRSGTKRSLVNQCWSLPKCLRGQEQIQTGDKTDRDEILLFANIHKDCAAWDTSKPGALVFLCAPSLFTSLLRGRWGTFLGSTSYTLGINPLQLCPLLPDILPALSCLPPPILLCRSLLTPAGPVTISIHFSQATHKCHM